MSDPNFESMSDEEYREWLQRNYIYVMPDDCTVVDESGKIVFDQESFLEHIARQDTKKRNKLVIYSNDSLRDLTKLGLSKTWYRKAFSYLRRKLGYLKEEDSSLFDPEEIETLDIAQNGLIDLRGIGVFKNLRSIVLSENPLLDLNCIETLQELEHFSMGLCAPSRAGFKLILKGLDKLPNLKSVNFYPNQENVDLRDWETVQVLQNLSDRGLLNLKSQMGYFYQHHYFKHFVMDDAERERYVDPNSNAYKRIMDKSPRRLTREQRERPFNQYKTLMDAIGFRVRGARSLDDYAHITETVNGVPSLNLTTFIVDTKKKESRFVKFYTSKRVCEKDVYVQKLLARTGLANDCDIVDLSRAGIDDLTTVMYGEQEQRLRQAGDASITTFIDRVTIARDNQGRKLGYALVTDTIMGENMTHYVGKESLCNVIDAIIDLHERASYIIPVNDTIILERNYRADFETIFFGGELNELAKKRLSVEDNEFSEAMNDVLDRLEHYRSKGEYTSFVHGDMKLDNLMRDKDGNYIFIDFERCSVGALKVADLVKLYDAALKNEQERRFMWLTCTKDELVGVADKVKDYYFRKAFGEDYNKEECEEMFALTRAMHYVEALDYYSYMSGIATGSNSWEQKKKGAVKVIKESLLPYISKDQVDTITNYLMQRPQEDLRHKDFRFFKVVNN